MAKGNAGLVVLGIAFIVCIIIIVAVMKVDQVQADNTLTVSGNSEISVKPDVAYVYAGIVTEAVTAAEAQSLNAEKTNKLMEVLNNFETENYNLYPKYNYDKETGESSVYAYRVEHSLKITVEDLEDVGNIADLAVKNGANKINRIDFNLIDPNEAREEALKEAAEMAEEKAEAMAKAMGVKLKDVKSVSESSYNYRPYVAYAESAAMDLKIAPEDVEVSASVSVVYKIS